MFMLETFKVEIDILCRWLKYPLSFKVLVKNIYLEIFWWLQYVRTSYQYPTWYDLLPVNIWLNVMSYRHDSVFFFHSWNYFCAKPLVCLLDSCIQSITINLEEFFDSSCLTWFDSPFRTWFDSSFPTWFNSRFLTGFDSVFPQFDAT